MKHELIRIENMIVKENGIKTLDNFFMHLYKGELLGVFANNATDKRHFIDLLCGRISFGTGRICYGSKPIEISNYQTIRSQKIALIQPQSKLVDDLTVASNIFIVRDAFKQQFIHENILENQAAQLMEELGIDIQADSYVYRLTRYEKTLIEIVKVYGRGAEMLLFEDLSRYLTDLEIQKIHQLLGRLKSLGISSILIDSYASVFENVADRVMVMEKGRNIWTFDKEELLRKELDHFIKNELSDQIIQNKNPRGHSKVPALKFEKVTCKELSQLSFELQEGQLLSIFDREGKGVDVIGRILKGEESNLQGCIEVNGRTIKTRNPWQAVKKKIGFVSENPSESMLFDNLTAIDNLTYTALNKLGTAWFKHKYYKSVIAEYEHSFSTDALYKRTDQLSTYDRHRLAYLKWHLYNPKVLICFKPFSSVDMALRDTTLELMRDLMAKGIAILILTSNFQAIKTLGNYIDLTSEECPL